jgi:hypothetical protein
MIVEGFARDFQQRFPTTLKASTASTAPLVLP